MTAGVGGSVGAGAKARALLLAALLAGGAALAVLPLAQRLRPDGPGPLPDTDGTGVLADGLAANATAMARLAEGLAALAGRGQWPSAPPASASELLEGMLPGSGADDVPPAPLGPDPLHQALSQYLADQGHTTPLGLESALARLHLQPDAEAALARLVAAFREARALQAEAIAGLSDAELDLLALHPEAVARWHSDHPDATEDDLDATLVALTSRIDLAKSLRAASLLARTVEAVRPALALPPAPAPAVPADAVDPEAWQTLAASVAAAFGSAPGAAPALPEMPLADALDLLALAGGQPTPEAAAVPPMPAGVEAALSRLAVAHAYGLVSQDPLLGGLAILDAAREAAPALEALATLRQLAALPQLPADPGTVGPPVPGSPEAILAALAEDLRGLGFDPTRSSHEPTGLVPEEAPEVPPLPDDLPLPAPAQEFVNDPDGDGVGDGLERLAGTDIDDPDSHPVGGTLLQGLPVALLPPTGGPFLTIGRPNAPPSEPALLIVGDVAPETVQRRSLLHVDLGGDDRYLVPVGTSTNLLVEIGGDDEYDTPATDGTQGSASVFGAAVLLDLAGDDAYSAGERSQGSSCCGSGGLQAPDGGLWTSFDAAAANVNRQGGGLGLLADLAGDDTYRASRASQGYASNLAVTPNEFLVAPDSQVRGFAGILFDAGGDDRYQVPTQGFAEVTVTSGGGSFNARPVGLLADLAGDDTYDNSPNQDTRLMPVDEADTGERLFRTQGYAIVGAANTAAPSPAGVFADLGGDDTYLVPALNGAVVAAAKNDKNQVPAVPTTNQQAPVRFFLDLEPTNAQAGLLDGDGDGAASFVETLAGTSPTDPADSPGSLLSLPPGAGLNGTLVRAPSPLRSALGGTLVLPGLAIAGRGHDLHGETFDLFVDLGGDDTYTGVGHGGAVRPVTSSTATARPEVRLAVDVAGNDTYRPTPRPADTSAITGFVKARYRSDPALGGAHVGVSVLADLGGTNLFNTTLEVRSTNPAAIADSGEARAKAWGVTMGAGLFGGVGVLVTDGASNRFESSVRALAEDLDNTPQATADAFGVSQGAGYLGVGVLANLGRSGEARDTYFADAAAQVPPSPFKARTRVFGVVQGASLSGLGVLADAGGDNAFDAPDGFAQGTGWGLTLRDGATVRVGNSAPEDGDGSAQRVEAGAGVGLLLSGGGDDTFRANGPAQGAGGGEQEVGYLQEMKLHQQAHYIKVRGGVGLGTLVDLGGDDTYEVAAPSSGLAQALGPAPIVAQAAALADSVGVLADLSGDDRYSTGPGAWTQGAAVAGVALLLDLEGQDQYTAGDSAQGYAQAGLMGSVRERVCLIGAANAIPCNQIPPLLTDVDAKRTRGNQVLAEAVPTGSTVGLLVDADGLDRYVAGQTSQGLATDKPDAVLGYAFCRSPQNPNNMGQPNFSLCPLPEGRKEVTHFTAPSEREGIDYIPTKPLGPAARGPLVGALLDADGTDVYEYADDHDGDAILKVPLDGTGPNDWAWKQEDVARRTAGGTYMPANPLQGPLAPISNGQPSAQVSQTIYNALENPPRLPGSVEAGGQEVPVGDQEVPLPTFGGGIDASTLSAALRQLADSEVPVPQVTLRAWSDQDATVEAPSGATVSGLVLLDATVDNVDPDLVAQLDLVADRGTVGRAAPLAGSPGTFRLEWQSGAVAGGTAAFPDGLYRLRAAAVLRAEGSVPGRTVESGPLDLHVDNVPILIVQADRAEMSGRVEPPAPEPVVLSISVGPDSRRPADAPAGNGTPGGFLEVRALKAGEPDRIVLPRTYKEAGPHQVAWDGRCGGVPCPDGAYTLRTTLEDAGGFVVAAIAPLRLDSRPPETAVQLPPYLGTSFGQGPERILVPWTIADPQSLVGTAFVAGGPAQPCFTDRNGNGTLDPRDPVYLAAGAATAAGDVRLANPPAGEAGSVVGLSSPDLGLACLPTAGGLAVRDADGGGFGAQDRLVLDSDGSLGLSAGDVLLSGPDAGTVVAATPAPAVPLAPAGGAVAFLDAGGDRAFAAFDTLHLDDPAGSGAGRGVASTGDVVLSGPRFGATVADGDVDNTDATVDLFRVEPSGSGFVPAGLEAADQAATQPQRVVEPARHKSTVSFVTIGRDRLGNSESGCESAAGEAWDAACVQRYVDEHPEKVVLATVDLAPPEVEEVRVSRQHLHPGQPVTVNATITEDGTGLVSVRVLFSGDPTPHPMQLLGGDEWTFTGPLHPGLDASERTVAVTVEAVDLALNTDEFGATFVLDEDAPRIALDPVRYFRPGGKLDDASELEVGRRDGSALVSAAVADGSLQDGLPGIQVQIDPSPLNATLGPVNLEFVPLDQRWVAEVRIPFNQEDGAYALPLRVRDAAGNLNLTLVPIVVDSSQGRLSNVTATATHDTIVVAWDSRENATTQAAYGRSAVSLGQVTPLDTARTREHVATIAGLAPNTQYFVQGVSVGGNGVENRTAVVAVRTQSAIVLDLEGLAADGTYGGQVPIRVGTALRTGEDAPVHVAVSAIPDNSTLRPIPLMDLGDVRGRVGALVDLRGLPDGLWSLVLEATRPGDQATLVSARFQVDNGAPFLVPLSPAPGALVNQSRPAIQVAIGDPGAPILRNWTEGARLLVDGEEVPAEAGPATGSNAPAGTATLQLRPLADLRDGEHRIEVRALDGGGNEAQVAWPFTVDTRAPDLGAVRALGPGGGAAAPPGKSVRVEAEFQEAGGMLAAYVDGGWLPQAIPLRPSGGVWAADVPVPPLPDGEHAFRIQAFDRAGNHAVDDRAFTVAVDASPPRLGEWSAAPGMVGGRLTLVASEPVRVEASVRGTVLATTEELLQAPILDLAGLRPGRPVPVDLRLVDAAGWESTTAVTFETLADPLPPGAPGALRLASEEEGLVEVAWTEALDNAGVDHYEVAVTADGAAPAETAWQALANATARSGVVPAAAGETVRVHLRAVDLAGLSGPAASEAVEVLALPHIEGARATTEVAKAGQRILFEATYRHPAGRPANVTLHIGDLVVPMSGGDGDCRVGCRYTARVALEATDLFSGPPTFTVQADDGVHRASSEPQPAPLVASGDGSGLSIPAVAPGLALLLFAFAAWRRRR
jgi:hypothetical protein